MEIKKTSIEDLLVIESPVFEDSRGYFFESFNQKKYKEHNLNFHFVQDNQSKSEYGVIRGLHYQIEPFAQTKLVRVLEGRIFDVCVDIRRGSPTFGKWEGIELSEKNKKQVFVPKGFAHGFSVLSKQATVFYKCDEFYNRDAECGIAYNDPLLNIDWKIEKDQAIVSVKDKGHPNIDEAEINFIFKQK